MNQSFITDNFRNFMAEMIFFNEVIRVVCHSDSPGDKGKDQDGNYINGLPSGYGVFDISEWELGDTGIIQNKNEEKKEELLSSQVTITYFSLWKSDGTYLGFIKLNTGITINMNDSIRIESGSIKIKF